MYAIYAYIGPRNHPWPDRQSYGSPRQVVAGHWKVHPAVGSTMFLFRLVSRFSMFLVGLGHNRHGRLAIIRVSAACRRTSDSSLYNVPAASVGHLDSTRLHYRSNKGHPDRKC